jgi:hypothetical protein
MKPGGSCRAPLGEISSTSGVSPFLSVFTVHTHAYFVLICYRSDFTTLSPMLV